MGDFEIPKTEYVDPAHPGQLGANRLLPWQATLSDEGHKDIGGLIKDTEGIIPNKEGVQSANDASDALFNQNVPAASRALASRARRSLTINQKANAQQLGLGGVARQQRQMQRLQTDMQNVEKLKKINYEGQLRFADQISDYNDKLEAAKYQVLSNVISGAANFYGGVLGSKKTKTDTTTTQDTQRSPNVFGHEEQGG